MEEGPSFMWSNIPSAEKFNPSLDLIEDNLYLGDLAAATDANTLDTHGITRILTIDVEPLPTSISENDQYTCVFIYALDREEGDLLSQFDSALDFISNSDRNQKTLVHCYFGVSRSATVVCAYLMRKHRLSVQDALHRLKEKRPIIGPNLGFLAQLQLFFNMNWRLDEENKQYKLYRLHHLARRVQKDNAFETAMGACNIDAVVPSADCPLYKCKKCRKPLFCEKNVFLHTPGRSLHWTSDHGPGPIWCNEAYLIQPLLWMTEAKKSAKGKLHCPECNAKLGSFDWKGSKCTCGSKMEPCFFIPKDKVDQCVSVDLDQLKPTK